MQMVLSNLSTEMKRVEKIMTSDMGKGLMDVSEAGTKRVSKNIPPPKGAWLSCCHMAKGVMQGNVAPSKRVDTSGTELSTEFGMLANSPSALYHKAHEWGSPQGNKAKLYFKKSVGQTLVLVSANPGRFFRRRRGAGR